MDSAQCSTSQNTPTIRPDETGRRPPRVAVHLPAVLAFHHPQSAIPTLLSATATELSPNGVFISVAERIAIDTPIDLEICAPIGPTFVGQPTTSYIRTSVRAHVVRRTPNGVGLVFETAPTFETCQAS